MPHLSILNSRQQEMVHSAALDILKSVGCKIQDKKWLDLLSNAGARVDYAKSQVFITDEDLITTSLDSCGKVIKKMASDPDLDFILGKGHPKVHTPEGATNYIDVRTKKRRLASLSDLHELTRVCDALPNVDAVVCPLVPNDVPPLLQSIISMKTLFENSSKPVIPSGTALNQVLPYIVRMYQAIADDRDLADYSLGFGIFTTSPLQFPKDQLDIVWECTERGLACSVGSAPQAGSTAPATMAGMLAQYAAEILMGIVMCQVKNPGINQYVYVRTYLINPRFGSINCSNPEVGFVQAAATQLLKEKYDMLVDAGWAVSDSHVVGAQTAFEKSNIWFQSMLTGADMLSGAGGLSSGLTASCSQAIIDNEIISYLRHSYSGMIVDDNHLGVEMIGDIGIGGTFLAHPRTGEIIRNEQWFPKISNHETYEIWHDVGGQDIVTKANEEALGIIETHKNDIIDLTVQKKLEDIINEAKKHLI
ncbi:MAG: trimethylamine methyltransferase family protein [Candidatus Hodarchaeales archaeon]|jgi:trimethylamine--corrinoid protein Co-methyltransferase